MRRFPGAIALLTTFHGLAVAFPAAADEAFSYYLSGDAADVQTATRGLIVLQGGGDDVDDNYRRMGEFAGGGDFVVLRASQADEYNDYILARCGCNSVETIVFESREAAFDPFVIDTIRNSEALFIAGGDQSRYVRFFKGTPVEDAIREVAARPAPVAGTSAGMAILGQYVYSAMGPASAVSESALADPYQEDITLEQDFLEIPALAGIITDQHLQERDRLGRTLVFLARLIADGWTERARAIAADRETALHIDPETGIATVYATAGHETPFVYLVEVDSPAETCEPGQPLTLRDIAVRRIGPGEEFDVRRWQGADALAYRLQVIDGRVMSSRESAY